jgi:mRNA-degrading endonuclease RelE of RelBE toxin-antitoxin system
MNVEYSRQFAKAAYALTGKYKESLNRIISAVKLAGNITEVAGCTKLVSFRSSYRIKMGDYRIIILVKIIEDTAVFQLILSRDKVYNKQNKKTIRKKEKE